MLGDWHFAEPIATLRPLGRVEVDSRGRDFGIFSCPAELAGDFGSYLHNRQCISGTGCNFVMVLGKTRTFSAVFSLETEVAENPA